MTTIAFCGTENLLTGFEITGHSGYAEEGADIVCASISSCAYMVANTVTEILHLPATAVADDGYLLLRLDPKDAAPAQAILQGFLLHVKELSAEYPAYILCKTDSIQ